MPALFRIEENVEIGRFAVAATALRPGDPIFDESPFVHGPKSDSPPLCLGCCQPADCTTFCAQCDWPVCGPRCAEAAPHAAYECGVFAAAGAKFQRVDDAAAVCPQYECIAPLRMLLAKEKEPERWRRDVAPMEEHRDARQQHPIWQFNQVNVVDYLRGPCRLAERFEADLIHKVCGILEINAFEARTPTGYLIRCLYPTLAILSHNCVSNITHSIQSSDNYKVSVRASVAIAENAELFSSYTFSLWPTLIRRDFLQQSKYFVCKCARCLDPTELGTHMGSLKCQKCDNGVIVSSDALSDCCEWKCTHCEFRTSAVAVRKVYDTVQAEIDAVEVVGGAEGIEQREQLFRKYRSVFHPKHAYMTILRTGLSQLYGKAEGYTLDDLPDLVLERKMELCQQLLEVLDVVEPGYTRIRGITLYELHGPLLVLARNQYTTGAINKDIFRKKMEIAVDFLRQSVAILTLEPEMSMEGQLGLVAKAGLDALEANFELLINTA